MAVLAVLLVLLVSSCEQFLQAAFDIDAPSNVEAGDGVYSDRIVITWNGVEDDPDADPPKVVSKYEVGRVPDWTPTGGPRETTDTSYTDTDVTPGVSYSYSVTVVYESGGGNSALFSDTGYAMNAAVLQVYSSPSKGGRSYNASSTAQWFNFLAQEGWTYRVTVASGTTVTVFRQGSVADGTEVAQKDSGSGYVRYRIPRSDVYHLKLEGGSGTVTVNYE
jgi:hypothetical protein